MTSDFQAGVLEWLSLPSTYGSGIRAVERVDTHISAIFLAGARAYKLKRAVRLPFLDFTTLEQRRMACERELVVNRRTAPDLYLGLVAVTRSEGGGLAFDGQGEVLDWVIVMARFDQALLFDRLAAKGELTRDIVRTLADEIARFHQSAEPQSAWGGEGGVRFTIDTNRASLERFVPDLFEPAQVTAVTEQSQAWLSRVSPDLERRRRTGLVRRCHGDLHLGNICLFEGRPTLFDAIEFNEDFACIDVLYDLSFLIMDLQARGFPDLASVVFNRYLERTGDIEALSALPLFLSLRAVIRAHVNAAMAEAGAREKHRGDALAYLARAGAYLSPPPPRLLAVGGLSGSGKSRLAADLAPFIGAAPGAVALRSDVLRKRLAGVDPFTRLAAEGYTEDMTGRTYAALYERAERILKAGHSVIADAVFARPEQRAAIEAVASGAGVPFSGIWLDADPQVLRDRVDARRNDASDATVAVLDHQLTYPLGTIGWHRYDASGGKGDTFTAVRNDLRL